MSELANLERDLDRCIADVREIARTAAVETAEAWHAVVESMTGAPPAVGKFARGAANPAEYREVIIALHRRFVHRAAMVVQTEANEDALWTFRNRRLSSLVESEVAAYIAEVAPRVSVASAFARAAGSVRAVPVAAPRIQLLRCRTCGAPRHRESTTCAYCGHPFFQEHGNAVVVQED